MKFIFFFIALAVPLNQCPSFSFIYGWSIVTPPLTLSKSQWSPIPIWEFKICGLYWVNTPTVSIPELEQLLKTKSIILYFPPNDTAGLAILFVNTPSLEPCPPAKIIASISFFIYGPLSYSLSIFLYFKVINKFIF